MKKITLGIDGMSCSACSNAIEHYLQKQAGIKSVLVNLVMANATIEFDEEVLDQKKIEEFIKRCGYKSKGIYKFEDPLLQLKKQKIELLVYSVLFVVLLTLSMGTMIFHFSINPIVFSCVTLALTLPFFVYGRDIFWRGLKSLFHGAPNMDTLVLLGVMFSFAFSVYAFVMILLGSEMFMHQLYFEACATIVYFTKLGRFLEARSRAKTKSAVEDLVKLTPENAVILKNGEEKVVTIDEIQKGDIVICRAGEKIAVDGVVVKGKTHVDESFINGESKPKTKNVGDSVVAGSISYDGYIEYEAENIGKDSTISQIVRLVVEASNTKMPISRIADKVCAFFVPGVILLGFLAFLCHIIAGHTFVKALITFVTVLVVACPCSLGLGTPIAIVVSEGVLAKGGILVKKSETLEIASKVNVVIFDKTGTLTNGKLAIEKISSEQPDEMMQIAVSLEKMSSHPISKAFEEWQAKNKIEEIQFDSFSEIAGMGLKAQKDGEVLLVGNKKLLAENGVEVGEAASEEISTTVFVAKGKSLLGYISVADTIKESAFEVVRRLKEKNVRVVMLSGDNEVVAKNIASRLGIDEFVAGVMPTEKAERVKEFKKAGNIVAMVGDGINDSPALAHADFGISVHGSTFIAINSADIVLLGDDLTRIDSLISTSRKTIRNIKQNLFWAFFYNVLMIPIAMGALEFVGISINPMIAALAMMLSSLSVVLNALRLRKNKVGEENGKQIENRGNAL